MLLDAARSLLLLVDSQTRLAPAIPDADACVRCCRLLIETAMRLDVPVVAIEQYPQGLGPTVPELAALLNPAQVHAKRHFSCAAEPRIVAALDAHARPTLVICGMEAHVCVLDLDYAADTLINGAFFSTGQKCTACSRAVIERSIYEALVVKLIEKTRKLKVGNGLEQGVQIGPAVDAEQLKTDLDYIEIAQKEGAQLLCGGKRLSGGIYDKGFFIEPTIFGGVATAKQRQQAADRWRRRRARRHPAPRA
jgi:hypothetical protein